MKRLISLRTEHGESVLVYLDNWGCGIDKSYRRWVREQDGWVCVETGEMACRVNLLFGWLSARSDAGSPA